MHNILEDIIIEKDIKVVFPAQNCVELWEEDVPEIKSDELTIRTEVSKISTFTTRSTQHQISRMG